MKKTTFEIISTRKDGRSIQVVFRTAQNNGKFTSRTMHLPNDTERVELERKTIEKIANS